MRAEQRASSGLVEIHVPKAQYTLVDLGLYAESDWKVKAEYDRQLRPPLRDAKTISATIMTLRRA